MGRGVLFVFSDSAVPGGEKLSVHIPIMNGVERFTVAEFGVRLGNEIADSTLRSDDGRITFDTVEVSSFPQLAEPADGALTFHSAAARS